MASCHRTAARFSASGLCFALLLTAGCGESLKTYPVRGQVVFEGGDIKKLSGASVEFLSENDKNIQSTGEIQDDGSFEMKTFYKGRLYSGVPEGLMKARILLPDGMPLSKGLGDEKAPAAKAQPQGKNKASPAKKYVINERFLSFNASKLTFTVPTDGEITIKVSEK